MSVAAAGAAYRSIIALGVGVVAAFGGGELVEGRDLLGRGTMPSAAVFSSTRLTRLVPDGDDVVALPNHLRLAKQNGLTETELTEAIVHLAFYAGWPKAMSAIQVAKWVFAE
ncbi:MAG TPA: carboxymuconolactone decarboxylase family protein [Lapillicoccus sp.]